MEEPQPVVSEFLYTNSTKVKNKRFSAPSYFEKRHTKLQNIIIIVKYQLECNRDFAVLSPD